MGSLGGMGSNGLAGDAECCLPFSQWEEHNKKERRVEA